MSHISRFFCERVQIDSQPLPERQFLDLLGEFLDLAEAATEAPSWFELIMAFALWVLACLEVDYAVVKTGMGELHDASNVCCHRDKVCVLTDVGIDHTRWLGRSILQFSSQKAGIIHPGNVAFHVRTC